MKFMIVNKASKIGDFYTIQKIARLPTFFSKRKNILNHSENYISNLSNKIEKTS